MRQSKTPERRQAHLLASCRIDENGCWRWQKCLHGNGYGKVGLGGGKTTGAHQASFRAFRGEIPEGLNVCHTCDVRDCINPDHLFLGTQSDNIKDAVAKGRMNLTNRKHGEENSQAKLTDAHVVTIRLRLAAGEAKAQIARSFGVTPRIILLIDRREIWRHVP